MKVTMYRSVLNRDGYVAIVKDEGKRYVCDGRKKFLDPVTVVNFCTDQMEIDSFAEENVICFALNSRGHLMGVFTASKGTSNASFVSIREIFQKLLSLNASALILVHNHPSGDPTPSDKDNSVTQKVKNAGEVLDISLFDHIIIGNYGGYYSYAEHENL